MSEWVNISDLEELFAAPKQKPKVKTELVNGMTRIIGGKSDGNSIPQQRLQITLGDETYLMIGYRDKDAGIDHLFYMLAGMIPAEAAAIYRERIA